MASVMWTDALEASLVYQTLPDIGDAVRQQGASVQVADQRFGDFTLGSTVVAP